MNCRLRAEVPEPEADTLWTAAYMLSGLRFPGQYMADLIRGVRGMEESTTYQLTLEEGGVAEARRLLLRLGTKQLGPPDAATVSAINSIRTLSRLEDLHDRATDVSSWRELLATP